MQAIVFLLIIFAVWILWSEVKQHKEKTKKQGDVIDISEAWIDSSHLPYRLKNSLLSDAEITLYRSICRVLKGSRYTVFPKVRLAEILDLPARSDKRQEYLNRIKVRKVDFIICELPRLVTVLAVTVEVKSSGKERVSDNFTAKAIKAAGLGHLVYNPKKLPNDSRLRADLAQAGLKLEGASLQEP
jgi:hypothetical protein